VLAHIKDVLVTLVDEILQPVLVSSYFHQFVDSNFEVLLSSTMEQVTVLAQLLFAIYSLNLVIHYR
jgi:hypothetical protein